MKIRALAHVNMNVTDLDRAEEFYTRVLGFHVSGRIPGQIVWLNLGQYEAQPERWYHDFALYRVPNGVPDNYRKRAGLNHVAFLLPTPAEVDAAAEELRAQGVKVLKGPLTHKEDMTRYLYFEDPDGNVLELVSPVEPGYIIPGHALATRAGNGQRTRSQPRRRTTTARRAGRGRSG
ncbi:MAG: VOC family protein [Deltaproteobacteria bacterium]|nr:VOC family protein [Deltaproteobacteria bacterium]MBI3076201.1 VOC family protein [Deltaproteobacteria bacterium]